jgi:Flp pilus assembly protein TadD
MPQRFHVRRLAGFAIAALALGTAPFARAADTPTETPSFKPAGPTAKERLVVARKAIDAKDWNKALNELNLAAKEDPRNADVQNLLGYSYRKRSNPDLAKAFEHYNEALKLNPKHKGAHEYIGEAYLMDKKPAEAQKHLAQLEVLCGNKTCEEYADLAKAIADYNARATAK